MIPLYIAIGGMIGALLRYAISGVIQGKKYFPAGTLGVNLIGSFLIGFVMFSSEYYGIFSQEMRTLITIGFLGSFTTMSTFSYESFRLLMEGNLIYFAGNIILNVGGCLLAVYFGRTAAMTLWRVGM